MQRLAPSLMPATRYVSKQLALIGRYFSIGETPILGKRCTCVYQRGKALGIGARDDRTRISRSRSSPRDPRSKD